MSGTHQTVVVRSSGSPGVVAGLLGCGLAVIGIFTIGFVFVPLAAICSMVGVVRGVIGRNGGGIGVSLLGLALTVAGFVLSPSLWLLFAVGVAVH